MSLLGPETHKENSPENYCDGIRTARKTLCVLVVLTGCCQGGSIAVDDGRGRGSIVQIRRYRARVASMEHGPLWLQNCEYQRGQARHEELRNDDEYVVYTLSTAYMGR